VLSSAAPEEVVEAVDLDLVAAAMDNCALFSDFLYQPSLQKHQPNQDSSLSKSPCGQPKFHNFPDEDDNLWFFFKFKRLFATL
jgi:hypothetical protein